MLQFSYQSGLYTLVSKMIVKTDLQTLWNFISLPENLSKITPPEMDFRITFRSSLNGGRMYPGQIIAYKVRPLPVFDASWVTEITQVQEKKFLLMSSVSGLTNSGTTSTLLKKCLMVLK
jgi:ligand-binding SRPBCC domain-containing protein